MALYSSFLSNSDIRAEKVNRPPIQLGTLLVLMGRIPDMGLHVLDPDKLQVAPGKSEHIGLGSVLR